MELEHDLERCHAFINCQLQSAPRRSLAEEADRHPAITLSRQAGSGGHAVADQLVRLLEHEMPGPSAWTIFDRNLVEKVLEDHNLPGRLARFMPEDRISEINDTLDELFGLHPPSEMLVHKTAETILHLAQLGRVILIGRAANVVTARLPHVLHVRLVAPVEYRVDFVREKHGLTRKEATALIHNEDAARKRYLHKYFTKDIEDPLLYHLVINMALSRPDSAARLIAMHLKELTHGLPQTVAGL